MKKKIITTTTALFLATSGIIGISTTSTAFAATTCKSGGLSTRTPGTLTIGTDNPAYSPWFDSNKPANGKGFESAIAYAVAKQLGYPAAKVKWVTASFNSVIQPGKKSFDFDINEISITPERAKAIDLSSGYYDVAQALVTVKGSGIEKVRTLAALENVKLGAQLGTTSYATIINVIRPKSKAAVFDTNDLAVAALSAGQVKGIVTDLPTAFYLSASVKNALIVGQFATKAGQEPFGLALTKGSPLTACVSAAVDALRAKGELKAIADKWLTSVGGAPVIK